MISIIKCALNRRQIKFQILLLLLMAIKIFTFKTILAVFCWIVRCVIRVTYSRPKFTTDENESVALTLTDIEQVYIFLFHYSLAIIIVILQTYWNVLTTMCDEALYSLLLF